MYVVVSAAVEMFSIFVKFNGTTTTRWNADNVNEYNTVISNRCQARQCNLDAYVDSRTFFASSLDEGYDFPV